MCVRAYLHTYIYCAYVHACVVTLWQTGMNNKNFANKIRLFANFRRFFAKWGLFFAEWGLLFAKLYVRKSPAFLLNLGHPIAPLRFVCAI